MQTRYAIIPIVLVAIAAAIYSSTQWTVVLPELELEETSSEPVAGMGISHYDLSNLTVSGETRVVVARLINTGGLDLNVTVSWVPDGGEPARIIVDPAYVVLKKGDSIKVYMTAIPILRGVCRGAVEIQGSRSTSDGGNQIVSGGSVYATITVV